jgi:hypothetical protein
VPLPEPPTTYGLPSDAIVALPGDGQVVYRVLQNRQPSKNDFRSDEAANRPKGSAELWIEHTGLSVFDDPQVAAALCTRYPIYIAEVEVPVDADCSIAKTGQPRHFSIWGDRRVLVANVRTVYRQLHSNGPLEPLT